MALQPNGRGLTEGTAAHWDVPVFQRVEHRALRGIGGLASRVSYDVPPKQATSHRSGIVDAFIKTCQRWHLSQAQQIILLGYKGSEFFGLQILDGLVLAPSQDVRDRAGYVLAISVGLGSMFDESEHTELKWLNAPRDSFNGSSPLAYMLEGRMENLMNVATMVAHERGL
jgi:hypothetical protein